MSRGIWSLSRRFRLRAILDVLLKNLPRPESFSRGQVPQQLHHRRLRRDGEMLSQAVRPQQWHGLRCRRSWLSSERGLPNGTLLRRVGDLQRPQRVRGGGFCINGVNILCSPSLGHHLCQHRRGIPMQLRSWIRPLCTEHRLRQTFDSNWIHLQEPLEH